MIKLGHIIEMELLRDYPPEVVKEIEFNIEIYDMEYGKHRNIFEDLGGYVVVIEDESEIQEASSIIGSDLTQDAMPEYVDIIGCMSKKIFTLSLFLCGSDFGIIAVMPFNVTPEHLLQYVDNKP